MASAARCASGIRNPSKTRPGKADACGAIQALIEPAPRALVLREARNVRINREVRVDEDQRKRSPSATASASATSSSSVRVVRMHQGRSELMP